MQTAYHEFRERLDRLRNDGELVEIIDRVGAARGWWAPGRTWRREYGRFEIDHEPFVTVLFESAAAGGEPQSLCTVEVYAAAPDDPDVVTLDGVGALRLRPFPDDPALPTLTAVMAQKGRVTVLRYRPGTRCTLRVDGADGHRSFVKVFDGSVDGGAMHVEALAIEAAAASGELTFAVAPSLGWDPELHAYSQGVVAGVPATMRLFTAGGAPLAERMGAAVATIATSGLVPSRRNDGARRLTSSRQYAARIARSFPSLAAEVDDLLTRLAEIHAGDRVEQLRPIHGAPHPHQWLLDGERLGLVDFDGFALGPPEIDVAAFVAEMEFENRGRMPVDAIIDGFRRGYESVAGPLDEQALRAHVAHKRLAKAQRNTRAVRGDGDVRAAAAVAFAREAIGG